MTMAETTPARIQLLPWEPAHLCVLVQGVEDYQALSGRRVTPALREFFAQAPAHYLEQARNATAADVWTFGYGVLHQELNTIIGTAGFKGPPDTEGVVEIAYAIAPEHEGRGYATETARALAEHAAADPRVRRLRAHTLPDTNASGRVLAKCGFQHLGVVNDPEDGPVWRWEKDA